MATVAILTAKRPRKRALEADSPCPNLASTPASNPSASSLSLMSLPSYSVESGVQPSHLNSTESPCLQVTPTEGPGPPVRHRHLSRSCKKSKQKSQASMPPLPSIGDSPELAYSVFTPQIPKRHRARQPLANPFEDHFELEHEGKGRRLEGKKFPLVMGGVNGYVKIAKPLKVATLLDITKSQYARDSDDRRSSSRRDKESILKWIKATWSMADKGLAWYGELSGIDKELFEFYIAAWCSGRTILRKTNTWLRDIAQMAHQDLSVMHALLALAGTYVYDYHHNESIKKAAEMHYKKAVLYLGFSLNQARHQTLSNRDSEALVSAIALLNMNDVVSPEHWRRRGKRPRWLEGARLACRILNMTDPGYRYQDAKNIQPSDARAGNVVLSTRAATLALTMMPLKLRNTDRGQFVGLLQGSEQNMKRIHGACGMSPLLLYHFSRITHVAAILDENPFDSQFVTFPLALKMLDELRGLEQWYEKEHDATYENYSKVRIDVHTIRDLLCSSHLDAHGSINTTDGMTASTAEAWRFAAIIYLQCRLQRLPRNHPEVLKQASNLAATIRVMPTSGYMFTAQAPFFPVFLLGIVAVLEEHSECAMTWFESVISTKCRSSVPPAYAALVETRQWMYAHIKDARQPISGCISDRYAWWEATVNHIHRTFPTLCLV